MSERTLTRRELLRLLEDIPDDDPVVLVAAHSIGFPLADVQPCLFNPKTGDTLSPEDEDVGPGYVRAVALLPHGGP